MVDLHFSDAKSKAAYNCRLCVKNPATAVQRRCGDAGFDNLKTPRAIDNQSLKYSFCPGKATWQDEIVETFVQCRTAYETGILPQAGSLEDQDELFTEAFPTFIDRWKERSYLRVWDDVMEHTKAVLEAVFGKKKGGK